MKKNIYSKFLLCKFYFLRFNLTIFIFLLFANSEKILSQSVSKIEHKGFMFRLLLGGGQSDMSYTVPDRLNTKFNSKSFSQYYGLQFGRAATDNFIIHLNLFNITNPLRDSKLERTDSPFIKNIDELNLAKNKQIYNSYGAGIGITYYLPKNFYISPEYRAAVYSNLENRISLTNPDISKTFNFPINVPYTSQIAQFEGTGLGFNLGWEGLVSKNTGLGFVLFYNVDWLKVRSFNDRSPYNINYSNSSVLGFGDGEFNKISSINLGNGSAQQSILGLAISLTYN